MLISSALSYILISIVFEVLQNSLLLTDMDACGASQGGTSLIVNFEGLALFKSVYLPVCAQVVTLGSGPGGEGILSCDLASDPWIQWILERGAVAGRGADSITPSCPFSLPRLCPTKLP